MKKRVVLAILASLGVWGCALDDVKVCENGETRCVGDAINSCVDHNWWRYEPCNNQTCEMNEGVATCVNICETGETQCVGNVLLECNDAHMWPDVFQGTTCDIDESCMSVRDVSFCANPSNSAQIVEILVEHQIECDEDLMLCGDNNTLYTCDANELKLKQGCGSQLCDKNEQGVMACIDVCSPSETKCEGNNLVTCLERRVYGKPTPCADGFMCTLDKDGISACVERNQSVSLCNAAMCVGNTLYQCVEGIYDNGTTCETCGLNDENVYACLDVCEVGAMKCGDHNEVMRCDEDKSWKVDSSCGEEAFCVVSHNEAFCLCAEGEFFGDTMTCETTCTPGCRDGYLVTCDDDGFVKTYCPYGCDETQLACTQCQTTCSDDGAYLLECQDNGVVWQKPCANGCRDGACIQRDTDGDGVTDDEDACPYNGAVTDDSNKCDELLDENGTFSLYCAQNLLMMKNYLDQDAENRCMEGTSCNYVQQVKKVELKNDINLADLEGVAVSAEGGLVYNDVIGLELYDTEFDGQQHRIYAEKAKNVEPLTLTSHLRSGTDTQRYQVMGSLFDVIHNSTVKNLTLDYDVMNGRGVLANVVSCSGAGEVAAISNIVVNGELDFEWQTQGVGGLVGEMSGILMQSTDNHVLTTCDLIVSDLRIQHLAVNAPNADEVGGIAGSVFNVAFSFDESVVNIDSVRGNAYVGGVFGYVDADTGTQSIHGETTDMAKFKIGSVTASGDYVGGVSGYHAFTSDIAIDVGTVSSENGAYVGGIAGYIESSGSVLENFAVRAERIVGNSRVGGLFGGHPSSSNFELNNVRVEISEIAASGDFAGGVVGELDVSQFYPVLKNISVDVKTISAKSALGGLFGTGNGHFTLRNVSSRVNLVGAEGADLGGLNGSSFYVDTTPTTFDAIATTSSRKLSETYYRRMAMGLTPAASYGDVDAGTYVEPMATYWYSQDSEDTCPWNAGESDDAIFGFGSDEIEDVVAALNVRLEELNAANQKELMVDFCEGCTWAADSAFESVALVAVTTLISKVSEPKLAGKKVTANFPVLHIPALEAALKSME